MKERVREWVKDYHPEKIKDSGIKMHLVFKAEVPVYQSLRRLSAEQRRIVNQIVNEWTSKGIVHPSNSEYASPIVLVKKKDGGSILCVDYWRLNRKIERGIHYTRGESAGQIIRSNCVLYLGSEGRFLLRTIRRGKHSVHIFCYAGWAARIPDSAIRIK